MVNQLLEEVTYKTSRSSGPGGQHVNKTETRVTLCWSVDNSNLLSEENKEIIKKRLKARITDAGDLIITGERYKSQARNKADVNQRFIELITRSLKPVKKRKPTRPTKASIEKRLEKKSQRGDLKKLRGPLKP